MKISKLTLETDKYDVLDIIDSIESSLEIFNLHVYSKEQNNICFIIITDTIIPDDKFEEVINKEFELDENFKKEGIEIMNENVKPVIAKFLNELQSGKAQDAKKSLKDIIEKKIQNKSKEIEDNLELLKKKQK